MTPSNWVKSNLTAIGSAAVMSVYAAGYVKTKAAADRFDNESDERLRAAAPLQPVSHVEIAATPTPTPTHAATAPASVVEKAAPVAKKEKPAEVAPKQAVDSTPTAAPAPAAKVDSQPAAVPAPSVPDTAQQPAKEPAPLKDGIYYGWGSSRHGDIQAAVEVKNGRILSAVITQCLTQYSCSWISALPPEVAQRQSAEVDYVSGATQSSNAFYYAVVQALKQAK